MREELPDNTPSGAQGWFINTRRDQFKNRAVREALIDAFDFEWSNKNIMYGAYTRTHSMFQNSDLWAEGKPRAEELALLGPFRGKWPDEVFSEPFVPPISDGSGNDRNLLRRASQLLRDAGYVIKDGKRVGPGGERAMSSNLQSRIGIKGVKSGLLRECVSKEDFADPQALAAAIKHLPVVLTRARPIDEAISSAGGVRFDAMDDSLMLRALPGVFCAGEMLDWEAPTGGYLLTACMASGRQAAQGALQWLAARALH